MDISTFGAMPGVGSTTTTVEKVVWQGREEQCVYLHNAPIVSTAVDAGNTPTTTLRAGLILGKIAASGKWAQYDADATDGTQVARAVLVRDISMLNSAGTAEDKVGTIMIGATALMTANLLIEGAAFSGHAGEYQARTQLAKMFSMDDDMINSYTTVARVSRKTADYTVVAADAGTLFVADGAGAVNFTLPTIKAGLKFQFMSAVNQNMVVTGSANLLTINNASANTLTFSTASNLIGAFVEVEAIYVNTTLKWVVRKLSSNTMTVA